MPGGNTNYCPWGMSKGVRIVYKGNTYWLYVMSEEL